MSGGGGKGGSQSTSVKVPEWLENAARTNMARADELAQIGYTPYYGPDVAAFSPMQLAAMQGTNSAAAAFGLGGGGDPMAGVPAPQTFAGGVQGYSSQPLFQQSMDAFAAARPGQFAALNAPFINPVTGAEPASPFNAVAAPGSTMGNRPGRGGGYGGGAGGGYAVGGGGGYNGNSSDRSAAEQAAMVASAGNGGWNGFGNGFGQITNRYDPYNDPSVVGLGTAARNAVSGTIDRASNSMGAGK